MNRVWTEEMETYLQDIYKDRLNRDIAKMINDKFKTNLSINSIIGKKFSMGLKSGVWFTEGGINTRFKKGSIPANKGKKLSEEAKAKIAHTWFKKGHKPYTAPLYSERVDVEGYTMIKVKNERYSHKNWVLKHIYVWEQATGEKLKKNEALIFLDRNKSNFDLNNLMKVTRAELCLINHHYCFTSDDPEENKAKVLLARLNNIRHRRARDNGLTDKWGRIPEDVKGSREKKGGRSYESN